MAFSDIQPPKKTKIDQKEALHNSTKLYQSLSGSEAGDFLLAAHLFYLQNRESLMKTHKCKLVHVTPHQITEFENLENQPEGLGIVYQVGKEIKEGGNAFYSSSIKTGRPMLPIGFGFRNNPNLWANRDGLVDTGCDFTTIDISYYREIVTAIPNYHSRSVESQIQAVGSKNIVYNNKLDIYFCDKWYLQQPVQFTDNNGINLIGRDLLDDGIFTYEYQKWISFTKH